MQALGIDISHFTGMGWRKGTTKPVKPARPLSEILVDGRPCKSHELKQRLINEGLKSHICESCGLKEWRGRPIPLELEHAIGKRDDNRIKNLKLLCPNCHAQTETYRGRNIGKSRGKMHDGPP